MHLQFLRALALATAAIAVLAVPASAGVATDTRVSGLYRVVYVKVAGEGPSYAGGSHIWAVSPRCSSGPCSLRIRSRLVGSKAGYPLSFNFDGTTYEYVAAVKNEANCGSGANTVVTNAYDSTIISRFRVTRMSSSGRALTFKGTYSERFTLNDHGQGHGCGSYYTETERYTGYAVTSP